jgi:uncharacterized repeat protein (TIGR03803 family)
MTTSGICELFGFARPRRRTHGSASITSGWKMACALFLFCAPTAITSPAQTFRTLKNFNGTNGDGPTGPLVQGLDGNFYGTAFGGGIHNGGTVFKMTPRGTLTTLYSFCGQTACADGKYPEAGLVQGPDGNFYGMTPWGGLYNPPCGTFGCGTVFKITPGGKLTTLHHWCSETNCADGYSPDGLIQGTDGNLYGVATVGGGADCRGIGCGTVFKITPNGVLTTLHSFSFCSETSCPEGYFPSGLIQGLDGNFYGITRGGNGPNCPPQEVGDCGTVFKITRNGVLTTLHSFCAETNCADGYGLGRLIQGTDGNLYGTTGGGGANYVCGGTGCGTFFKITSGGKLTTLHDFCVDDGDLCNHVSPEPFPYMVQGTDGNFYGTTALGGKFDCYLQAFPIGGCGTVVKITAGGKVTVLYEFNGSDGREPLGLFQATRSEERRVGKEC